MNKTIEQQLASMTPAELRVLLEHYQNMLKLVNLAKARKS